MHGLLSLAVAKLEEKDQNDKIEALKCEHVHDVEGNACDVNPQLRRALLFPINKLLHGCQDELDCLEQSTDQVKNRKAVPQREIGAQAMPLANVARDVLYVAHRPEANNRDDPHRNCHVNYLNVLIHCK